MSAASVVAELAEVYALSSAKVEPSVSDGDTLSSSLDLFHYIQVTFLYLNRLPIT